MTEPLRVLTYGDLKPRKGLDYSRPTIAEMVEAGEFPAPLQLSPRKRAWLESEVDAWIAEKAESRRVEEK